MDICTHTLSPSHMEYLAEARVTTEDVKQEAFTAMSYLEGWCSLKKAEVLIDLILLSKPSVVVEIGVFGGKSLIPMAFALRANGWGKVYGIDPWDSNESIKGLDERNEAWWKSIDHQEIFSQLMQRIDGFNLQQQIELIVSTSEQAPPIYEIDILHIDGNHSAESSYHDVIKWVAMVKKGGLVILNDVSWLDPFTQELTQSRSVKWLNAHCKRKNIFRESSDWAIWIKS